MAALTNTTPEGISQFRNTLRVARYLSPTNKPAQAGVLIEHDADNPLLWDVWSVDHCWDDAHEAETQGRTCTANDWAYLVWARTEPRRP
jgi:hypothetical protein